MIPTAEEARKDSMYKELQDISDKIYNAMKNSEFEINCDTLSSTSKKYLENLGYEITTKTTYSRRYINVFYVISWEK